MIFPDTKAQMGKTLDLRDLGISYDNVTETQNEKH